MVYMIEENDIIYSTLRLVTHPVTIFSPLLQPIYSAVYPEPDIIIISTLYTLQYHITLICYNLLISRFTFEINQFSLKYLNI